MIRQVEFNSIANEVSNRYTHFLETLLASYNRTILSTDLTARGLNLFAKEINNIHNHYLEREVNETVAIYEKLKLMIAEDVQANTIDVLADEEWAEYLSANTNFLYEAIKLQSSKDVLYINNFIRSKFLQLMSLSSHEVAYDLVYNHSDLSFYYTDKIGRKINSIKYIRTVSRDYMVKNFNDMIAGSAILNGVNTLVIENVDANHKDNGKTISVNDKNDVNYFGVREELFHPNSNSILRFS